MQGKVLHQPNWAQTAKGTPLELFHKKHTADAPLLFIGGVHGDEPEGVRLALDFLHWLKMEEDKNPLPHNWYLIPCLNPDGYSKKQRTNAGGVDLNRNFPSKDWSPEHKAPRYFPGSRPGSELEVQALVKLCHEIKPRLIVHFHSWEPCVVYTGAPGATAAKILGTGTTYPVREDIGYPTPGSLGQYGWLELQTPVVCVEAQDRSPLDTVWPIFQRGLTQLMRSTEWTHK